MTVAPDGRRDPGGRRTGPARRIAAAALATAGLVAGFAAPAAAAPALAAAVRAAPAGAMTVEQAEAAVDTAYRSAEVASEQLDGAVAASTKAAAAVADARAAVTRQQQAVATLRVQLGNQAAASYRTGGLGVPAQMLLAGDPDRFLDSLSTAKALREQQGRQLGTLQDGLAALQARQAGLVTAEQTADRLTRQRTATKATLDSRAADAQAVLDRLAPAQRAQLVARARAAFAADQAAAPQLLAAADAQLSAASVSTDGGAGTDASTPTDSLELPGAGGGAGDGSNSRVTGGGSDGRVPDIATVPGEGVLPVVDDASVARVLAYAAAQLGHPYVWGATGPTAFDCSGLALRAWQQAGVTLPRTSAVQWATGRHVAPADMRPGDLVFFYTPVSHVGIYIGGGKMINASNPRTGVKISNVFTPAFVGAVRPA